MRPKLSAIAVLFAALSLAASLFVFTTRPVGDASRGAPENGRSIADLENSIAALSRDVGQLRVDISVPKDTPEVAGALRRLNELEVSVTKLQSALDGISLEEASDERDALFRGEDGYLKADEYFAAEKFAIAGEGYLAFLEAHPDHPDAYNILERARDSFRRAGYRDKAIWAQEELMTNRQSPLADDFATLASLEKEAGRYDDAIRHTEEGIALMEPGSARLWSRMYWAWYNQLRDGNQAGLEKYREVEREIAAGGYSEDRLGVRVREKIDEIERLQSAQR